MRPEWYADKRDLVKWSVLYHLAERFEYKNILQVAYYRDSKWGTVMIDGEEKNIPDEVLQHFRNLNNISKMTSRIHIDVFCDEFKNRKMYLCSLMMRIKGYKNRKTIIFLDPDTGLEPAKTINLKLVKKEELKELWGGLEEGHMLVLYQHRFREKNWIERRKNDLKKTLGVSFNVAQGPSIANDVVFYWAIKGNKTDPGTQYLIERN